MASGLKNCSAKPMQAIEQRIEATEVIAQENNKGLQRCNKKHEKMTRRDHC